jgi:hypothetical protein
MSTPSPISASSVGPAADPLIGVLAATGPAEDELVPPVSIDIGACNTGSFFTTYLIFCLLR